MTSAENVDRSFKIIENSCMRFARSRCRQTQKRPLRELAEATRRSETRRACLTITGLRQHFGVRNESHSILVSILFWPAKLALLEGICRGDGKQMGRCHGYMFEGSQKLATFRCPDGSVMQPFLGG